MWDLGSGEHVRTLEGHSDSVTCAALSPDSSTLVSGSADKTLRVWDLASGLQLHTLLGHRKGVRGVTFGSNGGTVISASEDTTLRWVGDRMKGACHACAMQTCMHGSFFF